MTNSRFYPLRKNASQSYDFIPLHEWKHKVRYHTAAYEEAPKRHSNNLLPREDLPWNNGTDAWREGPGIEVAQPTTENFSYEDNVVVYGFHIRATLHLRQSPAGGFGPVSKSQEYMLRSTLQAFIIIYLSCHVFVSDAKSKQTKEKKRNLFK